MAENHGIVACPAWLYLVWDSKVFGCFFKLLHQRSKHGSRWNLIQLPDPAGNAIFLRNGFSFCKEY